MNDIFTCIKRPQFYPLIVTFFFFFVNVTSKCTNTSLSIVCTTQLACFHFFCNTGVYVCSLDGLCNASVFTLSHLQTFHLLSTNHVSFRLSSVQIQFFYSVLSNCSLWNLIMQTFFACLIYTIIYLVRD